MSSNSEKDVNIDNAARGVWLVKVPKYISGRWKKASPMSEIGRLKITKGPGGKPDILFDLSDGLLDIPDAAKGSKDDDGPSEPKIPKEHKFSISDISHQHLAVLSYTNDEKGNHMNLAVEGNVVQKGECRPIGGDNYMELKKQSMIKASQPTRQVQQLVRPVNTYKPISNRKEVVEFDAKKKNEGKKSRDDKDKVTESLFAAFEKHQYYNIKDLEKITKQPIPYLKEILKEICSYNAKNPHKNMYELKLEYRHYNTDDKK